MSVTCILATIACDSCGAEFRVELDPAYNPPAGWSIWDVAVDAVRGGVEADGTGSTSVQDGEMLCSSCTKERDEQRATQEDLC